MVGPCNDRVPSPCTVAGLKVCSMTAVSTLRAFYTRGIIRHNCPCSTMALAEPKAAPLVPVGWYCVLGTK
jgi:hypothetical protein